MKSVQVLTEKEPDNAWLIQGNILPLVFRVFSSNIFRDASPTNWQHTWQDMDKLDEFTPDIASYFKHSDWSRIIIIYKILFQLITLEAVTNPSTPEFETKI